MPDTIDRTHPYRRRARRLRAVHRHSPARLHRSLRALCDEVDRRPTATARRPESGQATRFAQRVVDALDGPVLRYSTRQALLRDAEGLGIPRFEANLIIATVQHRTEMTTGPWRRTGPHPRALFILLVVATIQSLVGGLVWWVLA